MVGPLQISAVYFFLTVAGLPRSGKKVWKMNFFPGQGKVREFQFQSGKFRKSGKVMEKSGNLRIFKKVHC